MKKSFSTSSLIFFKAIVIALVFSSTSCNLFTENKSEKQVDTPSKALLVFIKDESASIKSDSSSIELTTKWLKNYLNKSLHPITDVLVTSIDNYSSITTTNHNFILWETDQKNLTQEVKSEEELQLEELQQTTKEKSKLRSIKKVVLQRLFTSSSQSQPATQTAILEMIPYLAKLEYSSIKIVYLCDLIQESNRRNFTKAEWPMPSRGYAQNLAQVDAQSLIKEFNIDNGFNKVASIVVLIPKAAPKDKLNNLNYYWDELFEKLGYKSKIEYVTGVF